MERLKEKIIVLKDVGKGMLKVKKMGKSGRKLAEVKMMSKNGV